MTLAQISYFMTKQKNNLLNNLKFHYHCNLPSSKIACFLLRKLITCHFYCQSEEGFAVSHLPGDLFQVEGIDGYESRHSASPA